MRPIFRCFCTFFCLVLLTNTIQAQDTPDIAQGLVSYAPFHGSPTESVNMVNGSIFVKIPLVSYPQVGKLALSFSVVYNPLAFTSTQTCPPGLPGEPGLGGHSNCTTRVGLNFSNPWDQNSASPRVVVDQAPIVAVVDTPTGTFGNTGNPFYTGEYFVIDSTGAQHPLGTTSNGSRSLDQSGYLVNVPSQSAWYNNSFLGTMGPVAATIQDANGTTYDTTGSNYSIRDVDGKTITIGTSILDSAGRTIPGLPMPSTVSSSTIGCPTINASFQAATGSFQWSVPGPNGGSLDYLFCYTTVTVRTNFLHAPQNPSYRDLIEHYQMLQSIVLPNKQFWGFVYDAADPNNGSSYGYAQLMQLIYPTGGSASYQYSFGSGYCADAPAYTVYKPIINSRTLAPGDGTTPTWTYTWGLPTGASPQNIVTSPLLDDEVHTITDFNQHCNYQETKVQNYQGAYTSGAQPLKTVSTTYQMTASPEDGGYSYVAFLPQHRTTTWQNGAAFTTNYTYDTPGFAVSEQQCLQVGQCGPTGSAQIPVGSLITEQNTDYDGTVLRQLVNKYYWQQHSDYFSANLLDLPYTNQVLDGSGNQKALTTYTYDEAPTYATNTGVDAGHPTTVTRWVNTGGSVVSHAYFDGNGMRTQTKDPNNNPTYISYQCSGSLPYQITNALGYTTTYGYDCPSGLLISVQDPNDAAAGRPGTVYHYNFAADMDTVSYPDFGNAIRNYNNYALPMTLGTTITATPDPSIVTSVVFDGLGRLVTSTAPNGAIATTTYDTDGRVSSVTNPHFSSWSPTDGTTAYAYDALNRKILQCNPDNGNSGTTCIPGASYLQWSYVGNITTSYDEMRNSWQRTSDALGRLTNVVEPNAAPTGYIYDTLGNLTTVNQPGLSRETPRTTRNFVYDSLSRLTSATNPETGTIGYAYLNGGGLCAGDVSLACGKTDARGITTNYSYDALNRLLQKSSGGGSGIQGFGYHYAYDTGDGTYGTNGIGRLVSSSNYVNADSLYSYDPMGRVKRQANWTPTSPNNTSIVTTAAYDLAGNLTSLTYPDGRTVSQGYDSAGRMTNVNYVSWNGNSHNTSYLGSNSLPEYDPAGHLINATMGSGTGLAASYDKRERIGLLAYGTSAQLLWGKQYQWAPNSNLQIQTDALTGTQRQFGYDNLNRLIGVQDTIGSPQDTSPFPTSPTDPVGGSGGAAPSWTDPDDSNVLLNPDSPSTEAGWTLAGMNVNVGTTAPDGTPSAFNLVGNAADSSIADPISDAPLYSGETMTGSVWMRSPTGIQTVNLYLVQYGAAGRTVSAGKTVTVSTNWQQFQLSGQAESDLQNMQLQIGGAYTFVSGEVISVWNPKIEDTGTSGPTITNFLPNSQRLTASSWGIVDGTAVDNSATAPDGTNTAATATATAGSTAGFIIDTIPNPAPFSGLPMTGSVWLRSPSGPQSMLLTLIDVGANGWSALGITTVTVTSDWQRFQVGGTNQNTLSELQLQIGGGSTFTNGQSIQVWGAQMELASTAGPYVATGASPVSAGTNLTNILLYSQQPNGPSWANSGNFPGIPNAVLAPDGSQTGYEATAGGGAGWLANDVTNPALFDGATLTGSVFLRSPVGSDSIDVYLIGENASGRLLFQGMTAHITSTWQRFTLTGQAPNGMTRLFFQIGDANRAGQVIDAWGSQMEIASTAGPYVATTALPVVAGEELTNILPNSQQLNGPGWGVANGSVAINTGGAPDGTTTAATVTATANSSDTYAADTVSNPSLYDGETVTGSVYLRVASGTLNTQIYLVNVGNAGWGVPASIAITVTTTWQRFSVTGTNQNGLSELLLQIGGAGSITNGQSIQVWGAQMVVGTDPAPYTPTIGGTTGVATGQPATLLKNGLNESYTYDSFGNIQQNGSFNSSYTAQNQMFGYAYDAAGNLLSNYLTAMTWDAESKLITAGGATYIYDAEGNRVGKQGVGVTDTIYFSGRPIARYSAGSWTDLIYGPSGLLAEVPGTENGQPEYRLLDHLGTQVGTVGNNGLLTNPLDYTPFGRVFYGATNDPYMFTGKERDTESGLDNFGARYYGSTMGRFMSPDWAAKPEAVPYSSLDNPQSLNLYAYVGNNPLGRADADGHIYNGSSDSGGSTDAGWYEKAVGRNYCTCADAPQTAQKQNGNSDQPTIQGVAASGTYGSKKAAAMAAEKAGLGSTRDAAKNGKTEEFGGWVISKDRKYTYTNPVTFGASGVFYADNVTVPSGYTAVGGYHTHPDPGSWGEGFSVSDMNWAIGHNMTSYVGMSYSGNVRSYTPGVTKYNGDGVTGDLIGNIP
jgi:RHS repeat-associated protein